MTFKIGDTIRNSDNSYAIITDQIDDGQYIIKTLDSRFDVGDIVYIKCEVTERSPNGGEHGWIIGRKKGKQLIVRPPIELLCGGQIDENIFISENLK